MSRRAAVLAALALLPALAHAQAEKEKKAEELDPKTKAAIDRAVEKAKEDIRNEVRAEMQGAQSAAEFLGAVAEGPKLEFFEVSGYFRVRGQILDNLSLGVGPDASGRYLFPMPFDHSNDAHSGYSTANMRFRLEPTLNVSEHVRVRAQVDFLDNHVLGSSTSKLYDEPNSPYPSTFYGNSRVVSPGTDPRLDTPYVSPKRVWGEVQTPVGLLSFGRMPSEWGLGIMTNAGGGIDDDFGDTVDRIQFALPPVNTPIGRLTFVPILDFDNEGVLYRQPWAAPGTGQPFSAVSGDDAHGYGLKVIRIDTADEVRRKHERNEPSVNYGAYYTYRVQRVNYPTWNQAGFNANIENSNVPVPAIERGAYANNLDLWFRYLSPRWRIEAEVAGISGQIADVRNDPNAPAVPKTYLRQWGGAVVAEYKALPNKLTVGGEFGVASGDASPGFGNVPSYGPSPYGSLEGAQICQPLFPNDPNCPSPDNYIRNFRFNPAYRVDYVLFRQILGQVTDAMYLKPKLRWDILPGLALDFALIYSRAMERKSTPSVDLNGNGGSANLGIEADTGVTYTSGDGFIAWLQWGFLEPLGGLNTATRTAGHAQSLSAGIAVKF
jgi:uncharacterized protein (TIGR04551 family)